MVVDVAFVGETCEPYEDLLVLLRFQDAPDIVYTEDFVQGHMTANPQALREGSLRYDHLQAAALSVEDSTALMARVMEERYELVTRSC